MIQRYQRLGSLTAVLLWRWRCAGVGQAGAIRVDFDVAGVPLQVLLNTLLEKDCHTSCILRDDPLYGQMSRAPPCIKEGRGRDMNCLALLSFRCIIIIILQFFFIHSFFINVTYILW